MEKLQDIPLTNEGFLNVISRSFEIFLEKGTSRSNDHVAPQRSAIARDLALRLGADYEIVSQGYGEDKEAAIEGRYFSKMVDITIKHHGVSVAGIGVKFVMQNYFQNSNNYFENMLGETANIRSANHPYFQVFIILDKLPYYKKDKRISRWETFTDHNISKYIRLSDDNIDVYFHAPNKTLIYVVHIQDPEEEDRFTTWAEYMDYYRNHKPKMTLTRHQYGNFGPAVILNDYETFIDKVYHAIKAL